METSPGEDVGKVGYSLLWQGGKWQPILGNNLQFLKVSVNNWAPACGAIAGGCGSFGTVVIQLSGSLWVVLGGDTHVRLKSNLTAS